MLKQATHIIGGKWINIINIKGFKKGKYKKINEKSKRKKFNIVWNKIYNKTEIILAENVITNTKKKKKKDE